MKKLFTTILACIFLTSCAEKQAIGIIGGADGPTAILVSRENDKEENEMQGYEIISQSKAKEIMDSGIPHIILDVREKEEYDEKHIPGAILIPHTSISDLAEEMLPDKDALILIYCRSGRRSKIAAELLSYMGYANVKEFGGIIDWQYETE